MADLATPCADGPRDAPMRFLWEERAPWRPGTAGGASVRRIGADPRRAVEVVDFDAAAGIPLHLGPRGRAGVEPMDPALPPPPRVLPRPR